jgi:hypothetical protein
MWRSFAEFFYLWIPAILVGTVVILALPWLAVIALLAIVVTVVAAVGSLAVGFVAALKALGRSFLSSRNQSHASQWFALEPGGSTAPTSGSAVPKSVPATPWFSSTVDQSQLLEEAGINPIDVYEYPYMAAAWRTSGDRSKTVTARGSA